jgi:hypothetical protein
MKLKMNKPTMLLITLFLLIIPITFAGWWSELTKGGLTGDVTHNVSLTIGNSSPVITYVYTINNPFTPATATQSSTTTISIWFIANLSNGVTSLSDSSSNVTLYKAGETTRTLSPCVRTANITTTAANYTCNVTMYFYDQGSNWNVNASISNTGGSMGWNDSTTFSISSTLELNLTPTSLTWGTLNVGDTNQQSLAPLNLANAANTNITNITVNGTQLDGHDSATGYYITSTNFTFKNDTATVCASGTTLINNSANVYNVSITRSGHGGTQLSSMYYCIPNIPNIAGGIYNNTYPWTIVALG